VNAPTPINSYDDYLFNEDHPSYRVVDIRPPRTICAGIDVPLEDCLGGSVPPHVRQRRAVQNVVQVIKLNDVLVDPLAFNFFSVEPVAAVNRFGKRKEANDTLSPYIRVLPSACVGATRSFQNYYHWLTETMPRTMRMLAQNEGGPLISHNPKLPFHRVNAAFPELQLDVVPIDEAHFIQEATTTTLTTNFMPDMRLSKHALAAEDVLLFPRTVSQHLRSKPRRIFISRRDVNTRVLNDESLLVKQLELRGFDCPVMSGLTLREQAELCANAEIIISTHGAGLSNMLFRNGRCKIVEIIPVKRWPRNNLVCMYNLSQVAGFDHYLFDCTYPSEEIRLLSQNWSIDHGHFLSFLDRLL
jgi:capsular polysaccharide biosynthesis protein